MLTPAHITVDFSNSDIDGLVFARVVRASRALEHGERVLATDGEGHACEAQVVRIQGEVVFLELAWDTWTTLTWDRRYRENYGTWVT